MLENINYSAAILVHDITVKSAFQWLFLYLFQDIFHIKKDESFQK